MTDAPKLWHGMTDAEKGSLLLAHYEGKVIEWNGQDAITGDWGGWDKCDDDCLWDGIHDERGFAYRVKPKAPDVKTFTSKVQLWDDEDVTRICYAHGDDTGKIANITHTYTITDGVVTACDTIIHEVNT
jgi:hypothetical protein